jgi:hypothetical protein
MRRLLAAAALLLAACGGSAGGDATTTPAAPGTTTAPASTVATHPVALWFLNGTAPTRTTVTAPQTPGVARQALELLLAGPPAGGGLTTAIPAATTLTGVVNTSGVLTAGFSADLSKAAHLDLPLEQIARTSLEFPDVKWVQVRSGGADVGQGLVDRRMLDSADHSDQPPWIELLSAQDLGGHVAYYGTADVFEATLQVRLTSNGAVLAQETVHASCGSGCRGVFRGTLPLPPNAPNPVVEAYSLSAEDGSTQNLVRLPVP